MVLLPLGYCIDSTEVTEGQYQAWLNTNPSTANQPSVCSWNTDFTPSGNWLLTCANVSPSRCVVNRITPARRASAATESRRRQRILTVSTRPRIGLDIARTPKLHIERLLRYVGEPLEPPKRSPARDPPYFKTRCCGASWVSSTDRSSAPPTNPCILENWVWRRFVLLGKFESTLPSSIPAHSPIVACAARWLSTTMVGFTSAAKAPATQTVTPLLV